MGLNIQSDAWPSTSQESQNHGVGGTKINNQTSYKSATLQPLRRSNSSDWNSDLEDTINSTTPLHSQKVVKFSASSISLNKLNSTGENLSKAAETSYV